jgi:hypothetical protein
MSTPQHHKTNDQQDTAIETACEFFKEHLELCVVSAAYEIWWM